MAHYLKLPSPACGGRLGWGKMSLPPPRPSPALRAREGVYNAHCLR